MRNISFSLTTEQIRNRTKYVTRRLRWLNLRRGERLQACVKCMGLKKGEKIERLCVIEVLGVRRELLGAMKWSEEYGQSEAILEGFPQMSGKQFVEMFAAHNRCGATSPVTRIHFRYV